MTFFKRICCHTGLRGAPMWTARWKIIIFMETSRSDCFQNKMGHFLMQHSGNHSRFPEKVVPCAVKINAPWRNFIIPIFMGDIKIIFGVKVTYIDVHRPPTSWVWRVKAYQDRPSWSIYGGSPKPPKKVVRPISRYLNLKILDFLYENDFDANADDAGQIWGNFQFFH